MFIHCAQIMTVFSTFQLGFLQKTLQLVTVFSDSLEGRRGNSFLLFPKFSMNWRGVWGKDVFCGIVFCLFRRPKLCFAASFKSPGWRQRKHTSLLPKSLQFTGTLGREIFVRCEEWYSCQNRERWLLLLSEFVELYLKLAVVSINFWEDEAEEGGICTGGSIRTWGTLLVSFPWLRDENGNLHWDTKSLSHSSKCMTELETFGSEAGKQKLFSVPA